MSISGKDGCHDNHGTADHSRDGREQGAEEDAPRIVRAPGKSGQISQAGSSIDEQAELQDKIEQFVGSLSSVERDLLLSSDLDPSLSIGYFSSWSGLLPRPDDFMQYPDDARKSIVLWNNAMILDESARADRLTDAAIKQSKVELILNFVVNVVFALASLVAFVVTGDVLSFGFLAIPAVSIVINLYREKHSEDDEQ